MNMQNNTLQLIVNKLSIISRRLHRYSFILFLIIVAALYGFIMLRISSLSNTEPTPDAISSQVQAARIPHIEQSVVNQLQSLQDNSVSVQALFDQARSNPFQ
jgi:hypothetical protein